MLRYRKPGRCITFERPLESGQYFFPFILSQYTLRVKGRCTHRVESELNVLRMRWQTHNIVIITYTLKTKQVLLCCDCIFVGVCPLAK